MSTHTVNIELADRRYAIVIGTNLIGAPETYRDLPIANSAVIVSNVTVAPLYADRLSPALATKYADVQRIVLPNGEAYKNWQTLNSIFDALLQRAADRQTVLFALGGGVIGDMTGFAAASYMRGIPYVQGPTTMLAQVDSSVGGKTAINHPLGKNMIGAFHQPRLVVADIGTLASLPQRELIAGLAEVIKYGPIADANFFDWLELHLDDLLAREPQALAYAIQRSCEIKAQVVSQDEREESLRAILNFGHTFGHAIEAGLGYGEWLHGEAVGCGMVMAADLSARHGLISADYAARIEHLIQRAGLPIKGPDLGTEHYQQLMRVDKKAQAGAIRFVLIEAPGRAGLHRVADSLIADVIRAHTN